MYSQLEKLFLESDLCEGQTELRMQWVGDLRCYGSRNCYVAIFPIAIGKKRKFPSFWLSTKLGVRSVEEEECYRKFRVWKMNSVVEIAECGGK